MEDPVAYRSGSTFLPTLSRLAQRGGLLPEGDGADRLKQMLTTLGVNQRGWRLLLSLGESLLEPMREGFIDDRRPLASVENLAHFLKLVQQCEMDVPPPPQLTRAWATMSYPRPCDHLGAIPVGLFKASWIETMRVLYRAESLKRLLGEDLPRVVRWACLRYEVIPSQRFAQPWAWHLKKADDWARRCTHAVGAPNWERVLEDELEIEGIRVVELVSEAALREEATIMRHCIDGYLEDCHRGDYVAMSIRLAQSGERIATLGACLVDALWELEDVRGEGNEEVEEYVFRIAEHAINAANRTRFERMSNQKRRDAIAHASIPFSANGSPARIARAMR